MLVVHVINSLDDGGAEGALFRLCTNDTNNRHVVISLLDLGKYGPLLKQNNVTVYAIDFGKKKKFVSGFFGLYKLMKKYKPDVVQTWMPHSDLLGGVAARLSGVKKVFWGIRHSDLQAGKTKNRTILISKILPLLSHVIPLCVASCADEAINIHVKAGYPKHKMRLIPNGYDFNFLKNKKNDALKLRADFGLRADSILIGAVGRFDPQKDHVNLIRALSSIRQRGYEFTFLLVGSGLVNNNRNLVDQLVEYGIRDITHLLGQRIDVPTIMSALDLHILASAFGEAFPNVVAEAMACETPCVVTDVGDAALIVGNIGWVVPPGDSEALANAVEKAFKKRSQEGWPQFCHSARERVRTCFGIEEMVSSYNNMWRESF